MWSRVHAYGPWGTVCLAIERFAEKRNLSRLGRSLTLPKWLAILLVSPASALCGPSVYEVDWIDAVRNSQHEVSVLASLERQLLDRDGERAARSGDVLTIGMGLKRAQHFVDGVGCGAQVPSMQKVCVRFLYLGYSVRSKMYYVYEAHYEGGFCDAIFGDPNRTS